MCVIRSGEKVVMVNEIITSKLSLPAGTIASGEDPKLAAQREAWEETGLVVSVGNELGRSDNAAFYDCVADSDIVAFQYNNLLDGNELPIWFAPHYGIEISSAMLVDPQLVPMEDYRFPEQLQWLIDALPNATDQSVLYVGNLVEAAPFFNQLELGWMVQLQHSLLKMPEYIYTVLDLMLLAGNYLANPLILLGLFPLLYWRFGKEFCYRAFFAVTVTSLLSLVAQQGFALPRPHVYLPAVELASSYGFGLPSLPIAVWLCVGVLVLDALKKLYLNRWSIMLLIAVSWLAIAKFYSGAAFMIDSISGALLGALCAWHIIRLQSRTEVDAMLLLSSKLVWGMLVFAATLLTIFWPIPVFTYWLAIIVTVFGLVATQRTEQKKANGKDTVIAMFAMVITYLLVSYAATFVSSSGLYSLIVETLRYPLLLIVFAILIRAKAKAA
ncbi:NUDIX domain-containing protein [Vibrio sp. TRT 2004]|uniref:NUDIX domain-containing protein n=1 Tax=Vibrio sp. TRT 2004 TaxID=3418506 RepID=UPI003CFB09E0